MNFRFWRKKPRPQPRNVHRVVRLDINLLSNDVTPGNLRRALQYAGESMGKLNLGPTVQTGMSVNFLGAPFAYIHVSTVDIFEEVEREF